VKVARPGDLNVGENVAPPTVVVNNKRVEEKNNGMIRYYERLSSTLKPLVP